MRESFATELARIRNREEGWGRENNLAHLSHPEADEIEAFRDTWFSLADEVRYQIVTAMAEVKDADISLSFEDLFEVLLEDDSAAVRAVAMYHLGEVMDKDLARTALDLLRNDSAATVRAEAATALGAYLAVREEGDPEAEALAREIEDVLLQTINTDEEDVLVRQRSLEAYAFADDPYVDDVLEEAYDSDEDEIRASAVFAMGRRGDEDWLPVIHRELRSDAEAMRFAAVCAATDIGSASSVPFLLQVIGEDPNDDVRIAAVFALAEIDTPEAGRILEELLDADDVAISAAADEALEIRGSFESPGEMLLFDYGLPDSEDFGEDGASNGSHQ